MNIAEFYDVRAGCIKCKAKMDRSVQISVCGFPFHYSFAGQDIKRDYGSSDIVFNASEKPPYVMNFRYGYLAKNTTDEPFEFKDSYVILKAMCKGCGQFSYHSTTEPIYESGKDALRFQLSHERYTASGEFIIVCDSIQKQTYLYISLSPVQRFILEYKPIDEWIVNGDESAVRGKLTKLKLLM